MKAKELADSVKEQMEEILKLADETARSEAFQNYLKHLARFHKYSFHNCMLIALQRPDATQVAGYMRWKELGRQVIKGEKGIAILAPMIKKFDRLKADGTEATEKALVGFRRVHVFDVSQTSGADLPTVDWKGAGRDTRVEQMFLAYAEKLGLTPEFFEYSGGAVGSLQGDKLRYSHAGNVPRTIAHEVIHGRTKEWGEWGRPLREACVDIAAAVVCSHFGIDAFDSTATYVAIWKEETDSILRKMDQVQKVAHEIIVGIKEMERAKHTSPHSLQARLR